MFEEVSGLPLHPLVVHAPVVLVPLLILVSVSYAAVPAVRRALAWAVVALAVLAPGSVVLARASGTAFRKRLAARDQFPAELAARVDEHAGFSLPLVWLVAALAVVSVGSVLLARRAGGEGTGRGGTTALWLALALVVLGLSVAAGWYLFQSGESGARMVWQGS